VGCGLKEGEGKASIPQYSRVTRGNHCVFCFDGAQTLAHRLAEANHGFVGLRFSEDLFIPVSITSV